MRLSGIAVVISAVLAMAAIAAVAEGDAAPASTICFEAGRPRQPDAQVDKLVFAQLARLGIEPANMCSDAVFVRRAFIDVIGKLPTADEAANFIKDAAGDKRSKLIDALLERDEFADYAAMKWSDTLRIKAEFPIKLWPKAAQGYHRWLQTCIRENRPYDRMASELLLATGSNFYVPHVNFHRAIQNRDARGLAQAAALTFMGVRTDTWPQAQMDDLAAFFSQVRYKPTLEWKEEIVYLDLAAAPGPQMTLPDGAGATLPAGGDARAVFADWLVSRDNPYFARCAANRVWFWLMGRGIVHESDDFRADNPPANPELLDYLAGELVSSGYDLKHVYRLILNSHAYQLSSIARSSDQRAAANFASYPVRRLEAEVLADALCQITGAAEDYVSAVPEPFTYLPKGDLSKGAVAIGDGNTSSAFLELFGRPGRDTGLASERDDAISSAQRLHLLNSSHVRGKIAALPKSPRLRALMERSARPRDVAVALYLAILSRYPLEEELRAAADYGQANKLAGRELAADLAWALINSEEFLYRH